MVLKRIDPSSCSKVYGVICFALGLIIGLIFALIAWMAGGMMDDAGGDMGGGMGMFFGAGAIIFFPILYGIAGLVMGYLSAVIYNAAARFIGGIELEFE